MVTRLVSTLVMKAIYDFDGNATQVAILEDLKKTAVLLSDVSDAGGSLLDFIPIRKC